MAQRLVEKGRRFLEGSLFSLDRETNKGSSFFCSFFSVFLFSRGGLVWRIPSASTSIDGRLLIAFKPLKAAQHAGTPLSGPWKTHRNPNPGGVQLEVDGRNLAVGGILP